MATLTRVPQGGLHSGSAMPNNLHHGHPSEPAPLQPISTKSLAITSTVIRGVPPPPLIGSAMVLVNDSALHCFGGRLQSRDLTNCHYVLDVETHLWETIHPAPAIPPGVGIDTETSIGTTATSYSMDTGSIATTATATTTGAVGGTRPGTVAGSVFGSVDDGDAHTVEDEDEDRDISNGNTRDDTNRVEEEEGEEGEEGEEEEDDDRDDEDGSTSSLRRKRDRLLSLSLATDPVDTTSGLPEFISHLPQARYFHTLNSFGTLLILFGGMGELPNSHAEEGVHDTDDQENASSGPAKARQAQERLGALNDIHVFDIITQRWQQKHPTVNAHTPKPRWAHLATILDHYLVVLGGTDASKEYIEDACVLDLHTWEWVASIPSIGQCGSYRTIAATGPSKQSSNSVAPSSPSFPPTTNASPPHTPTSVHWADSGPIDAMASISMVLSGSISAPSSTSSKDDDSRDSTGISPALSSLPSPLPSTKMKAAKALQTPPTPTTPTATSTPMTRIMPSTVQYMKKSPERLMSGELTPAFKIGMDGPSIYLYSNYNFQHLQRDFKVITPHYTHSTMMLDLDNRQSLVQLPPSLSSSSSSSNATQTNPPPSFSLIEKSQALTMMGGLELPTGLRFPQGHVYQNQLIITGTLIDPGKAPTLAIYALNLATYKWTRLSTDQLLESGSWNRSILHPASGSLLIFGNHNTNAEHDYANRLQRHDHLMVIDLQAYGLYERPIPSLPSHAQELGLDLLRDPSLSDMKVISVNGTEFCANSTILATRWPGFGTMLLSPPYVTPLRLILPAPDDVVPLFLQYLYTGALPSNPGEVTAGMADHLLILARMYELNGLYALTMDLLHQMVNQHPTRVYSTALLAGELGLQARAVGIAIQTLPAKILQSSARGKAMGGAGAGSQGDEHGANRASIHDMPAPHPNLIMSDVRELPPVPAVPSRSTTTPSAVKRIYLRGGSQPTLPSPSSSSSSPPTGTARTAGLLVGRRGTLSTSPAAGSSAPMTYAATTTAALTTGAGAGVDGLSMAPNRDSMSTDGGMMTEGLMQQYNVGLRSVLVQEGEDKPLYLSSPDPSPSPSFVPRSITTASAPTSVPGSGVGMGGGLVSPLNSPGLTTNSSLSSSSTSSQFQALSSPTLTSFQQAHNHQTQQTPGYGSFMTSSTLSAPLSFGLSEEMVAEMSENAKTATEQRMQQSKKLFQLQMQQKQQQFLMQQQQLSQQQQQQHQQQLQSLASQPLQPSLEHQQQQMMRMTQDFIQQQHQRLMMEQQWLKEQELMMMDQQQQLMQQMLQQQQQQQQQQVSATTTAALGAQLDYHFGPRVKQPPVAPLKINVPARTVMSSAPLFGAGIGLSGSGGGGNNSRSNRDSKDGKEKDKKDSKGLLKKMKPPKPTLTGAELMRSAGF